jgi:hypothetical protein
MFHHYLGNALLFIIQTFKISLLGLFPDCRHLSAGPILQKFANFIIHKIFLENFILPLKPLTALDHKAFLSAAI